MSEQTIFGTCCLSISLSNVTDLIEESLNQLELKVRQSESYLTISVIRQLEELDMMALRSDFVFFGHCSVRRDLFLKVTG